MGVLWFKKKILSEIEIESQISTINDTLKGKIKDWNNKKAGEFLGKAFIIFEDQDQLEDFYNKFYLGTLRRTFYFIWAKIFKWKKYWAGDHYFKGNRIKVHHAKEPSDIIWENLYVKAFDRVKWALLIYTVTAILLFLSFMLNFAIRKIKDKLENDTKDESGHSTFKYYFLSFLINIANGLAVIVINTAIGRIVRVLTTFEKYSSYTNHSASLWFKLISAMFVNTALIPLAVNFDKENWFSNKGLVTDVLFNTISISFFGPWMYIFSPVYILKYTYRKVQDWKGDRSMLNQRQYNKLWEAQEIDMAERYSILLLLFLLWCFYTALLPIVPIICFFGGIFQYWVVKWMLLRHHKLPKKIGTHLNRYVSKIYTFGLFLYSLSTYFFISELSGYRNWTVLIGLAVGFSNLVFPYDRIIKVFSKKKLGKFQKKKLSEVEHNFFEIYKEWGVDRRIASDSLDLSKELENFWEQSNQEHQQRKKAMSKDSSGNIKVSLNLDELIHYEWNRGRTYTWWDPLESEWEQIGKKYSTDNSQMKVKAKSNFEEFDIRPLKENNTDSKKLIKLVVKILQVRIVYFTWTACLTKFKIGRYYFLWLMWITWSFFNEYISRKCKGKVFRLYKVVLK
jgi:hypothetical protein